MTRRALYPIPEPWDTGLLPVPGGHALAYEQCGRKNGPAAVFLHGGPGAGIDAKHRGYFDPAAWRTILFDQRGAGRSQPYAGLENNTTWDLVADIERLREKFGIERWLVFGGSWGSTLALAYAEAHPERVTALVLRGIFLGRQREVDWLYSATGAASFYPDRWEDFVAPIPIGERDDLLRAYHRRLMGPATPERAACARAWSEWEAAACWLVPAAGQIEEFTRPEVAVSLARVETHYFVNRCFLRQDDQLLAGAVRLRGIPGVIVQGRYDMVCPPYSAWDLHRAWPASRLEVVPDAGHAGSEPGIVDALVRATDSFRAT